MSSKPHTQDTVLILAAGEGTRMGYYGKVPKHLLPYNGMPILSHLFFAFPKSTNFVVVLHEKDGLTQDYLKAAHPDLNVQTVVSTNPVRGSVVQELHSVFMSTPIKARYLWVVVGDGVWDLPEDVRKVKNWLGVAEVPYRISADYCMVQHTAEGAFRSATERIPAKGVAWTGVACFGAVNAFRTAVADVATHPSMAQVMSSVFNVFADYNNLAVAPLRNWIDLGTEAKYKARLTQPKWSADSQETYLLPTKVVKYFAAATDAQDFGQRMSSLPYAVPVRVLGNYVVSERLSLEDSYRNLSATAFQTTLGLLQRNLWESNLTTSTSSVDMAGFKTWHTQKVQDRVAAYHNLSTSEEFSFVNGWQTKLPWGVLLQKYKSDVSCVPATIHGDLTLSNLLVGPGLNVNLVDCRSYLPSPDGKQDVYYDLGKLWLSLELDLSRIRAGDFTVHRANGPEVSGSDLVVPEKVLNTDASTMPHSCIEVRFPQSTYLKGLQEYLEAWCLDQGYDLYAVKLNAALHMASMSGYHEEPFATAFYAYSLYLGHRTLAEFL